ncbi:MAG: hypothetical protein AAGI12_08005 [Pseudomonadota bacterium]
MATTLKQVEAIPTAHPDTPSGVTTEIAATVWARIESYIAYRWTPREVVWTVEGPGEWVPPMAPATITKAEVWSDSAWFTVTLSDSPLNGFDLPDDTHYRFTATVGAGPVPESVTTAFTRLAQYMHEADVSDGGVSVRKNSIGPLDVEETRNPQALARALQYSGAADLLRPYRRA